MCGKEIFAIHITHWPLPFVVALCLSMKERRNIKLRETNLAKVVSTLNENLLFTIRNIGGKTVFLGKTEASSAERRALTRIDAELTGQGKELLLRIKRRC